MYLRQVPLRELQVFTLEQCQVQTAMTWPCSAVSFEDVHENRRSGKDGISELQSVEGRFVCGLPKKKPGGCNNHSTAVLTHKTGKVLTATTRRREMKLLL